MTTGTSQANDAVIVVASTSYEFDVDISKNWETREHTPWSNMRRVRQMNVGVNKMDEKTANYSEKRYNETKTRSATSGSTLAQPVTRLPLSPSLGSTATT